MSVLISMPMSISRVSASISRALMAALLLVTAFGCASTGGPDKDAPLTGVTLTPAPASAKGYYYNRDTAVFENKSIRITIGQTLPIKGGASASSPGFLTILSNAGYLFLRMEIDSLGDKGVMYNTAHTSFLFGPLDYKKPLDYTDLYRIARGLYPETPPERSLSSLRGLFYDLNTSISPGGGASKLLLFRPVSEKTGSATLTLKEIYIGTNTVSVSFPFKVSYE